MMRWSYKTVHYEMKKEGLLGSAFLDESEVELSLNEYGKAGWELVSILETHDGLIAVLKQPLSLDQRLNVQDQEFEERVVLTAPAPKPVPKVREKPPGGEAEQEIVPVDEYEVVEEEREESSHDVGTIRIE